MKPLFIYGGKGTFRMARILADLVGSDRILHVDCLGLSVGRECHVLLNETLSFA